MRFRQQVLWFVIGTGLGLIPVAIFAIGAYTSGLYSGGYLQPGWPFLGCLLFPVILIFLGICFSREAFRPLAYGMLVAVLISPVVVTIACSAPSKG